MRQPVLRRALMVLAALTASAIAWSLLPERLPVHWNVRGEVDRWGSRAEGALMMPAIMLAVWGIAVVAPRIDPRQESYERMRGTFVAAMDLVMGFTLVLHLVLLAAGLGWQVPIGRVVPGLVGLLLALIGNILPRAKPNWMFGIRTPWTLTNDRVWTRTHRVGGYCMTAAGVFMIVAALLPGAVSTFVLLVAIIPAAVVPILYSYVAWRQESTR